jgi:hypothetical protein
MAHQQLAGTLMERLEAHFGPVDLVSRWLPFDFTDYYTREMGTPLYRRMVAFKRLVDQEALPDIKHLTNALEKEFTRRGVPGGQYRPWLSFTGASCAGNR